MAAPRTQQAHQKRVQKIVEEAVDKVAESSPFEEEVIVSVEERPLGEVTGRTSSSATDKAQQLNQNAMNAWFDVATSAFDPTQIARFWDPRAMVESSFRFYEELLGVQKDFALKLADAMPVRK